jgi:uncharacterized membrane protein
VRTAVPASLQPQFLLGASLVLTLALARSSFSQTPPPNQKPAPQPRLTTTSAATPVPKKPVGPTASSTHYPILLLAMGNEPAWSVRIGLKGPERLDRPNYPPIPLEPAEVAKEGATDVWTYHAKDSQTGASVTVHLSREACVDPPATTKFTFKVSVEHTQLGTMLGCARVATELFPKINNQPTDDDDDEGAKDKPAPPTVTNFKVPTAVAYFSGGKTLLKRGKTTRIIPGKADSDFSLSHDGKKLLFGTEDQTLATRSISEYDFDANRVTVLIRGSVRNPVWSPDDTRIAYLKQDDNKWQLWVASATSATDPASAVSLASSPLESIQGWVDAHTILVSDREQLYWITDDGRLTQALSLKELCGPDFTPGRDFSVRVHPQNPDLLLVSAFFLHPPKDLPASTREGDVEAFFLYELLSKRRALLDIPDLAIAHPEWSRDGLQIYFSAAAKPPAKSGIYRVFWDGTTPTPFLAGTNLAIGQ